MLQNYNDITTEFSAKVEPKQRTVEVLLILGGLEGYCLELPELG